MKYLAIMHEYYECDNSTPSDKIWAKVVELKNEQEKDQAEKLYLNEQVEDEAAEATVEFFPLEDLDGEWVKVEEI